jgi:hypothetical protein
MQVAKKGTRPNRQCQESANEGARDRTNWAEDGPKKIGSLAQRRQQDHPPIPLGKSRDGRNDECRAGKIKFVCTLSLRADPYLAVKRADGEDSEHENQRKRDGREFQPKSHH